VAFQTQKEQKEQKALELLNKPLEEIGIDTDTEINMELLKKIFHDIDVFITHPLTVEPKQQQQDGQGKTLKGSVYFMDDLVDEKIIDLHVIRPILNMDPAKFDGHLEDAIISAKKLTKIKTMKEAVEFISMGVTFVHVDTMDYAVGVIAPQLPARSISEPEAEPLVRGPREGFTEKLQDNTGLVRKRIHSPDLKSEPMKIGRRSQTSVVIMYIRDLVDDGVLKEAKRRLQNVDLDVLIESAQIEEFIEDHTFSPFPQIVNTERPDKVAAGLAEGRVAILVDGTPFALIIPSVFTDFLQASEDYYQRFLFSSAIRLLRILTFLIALTGPSLYIAITTFHQELIPTPLLFTIVSARTGVPFPALIEALIMEVAFEILREAGVRLPRPVGSAVSIVGGLVVGQAAVEAGIISQAMIIVMAFTGIASFTIPAFNLSLSTRLLRFAMMLVGAALGLFGIACGLMIIGLHLCGLRSFGVPYMAPFAPTYFRSWLSEVFVAPYSWRKYRPAYLQSKDLQERSVRDNKAKQKDGE
jgi:hypothetical protein